MEHYRAHSTGDIDSRQTDISTTSQPIHPAKRKRQPPDIVWTAKRCQRLLRSITSRLRVLRKLHRSDRDVRPHRDVSSEEVVSTGNSAVPPPVRSSPRSPTSPEWLPGRGDRPSLKYGRSKQKLQSKADHREIKHGGLAFPTPLVKRLLNPELHSPFPLSSSPSVPGTGRTKLNMRKSLKLPVWSSDNTEEARKNLLAAFETFLNSTKVSTQSNRRGAPSLMDMALHKASQYMESEESIAKTMEEEDNDAADESADIYAELENLGSKSGGGWHGLRELIRAHCLRHIERAIADGILPQHVVRSLLDLCTRYDALREGHQIIQAYLQADLAATEKRTFCLNMASYCIGSGGEALWLRCLTTLLNNEVVKPGELANNNTIWRIFIRLMTTPDAVNAEEFLLAYTGSLSRLPTGALLTTPLRRLQDAVSLLSAMAFSSDQPRVSGIHSRIIGVMDRIALVVSPQREELLNSRIQRPFLSASLLLHCLHHTLTSCCASLSIDSLIGLLDDVTDDRRNATNATADFACAVAKVMENMQDELGTLSMRRLIFAISRTARACERPLARRYLRNLALDCTLSYPGTCEDQECIEAAQGRGTAMAGSEIDEACQTPGRLNESFRWEEGLCEWVQATPALQRSPEIYAASEAASTSSRGSPEVLGSGLNSDKRTGSFESVEISPVKAVESALSGPVQQQSPVHSSCTDLDTSDAGNISQMTHHDIIEPRMLTKGDMNISKCFEPVPPKQSQSRSSGKENVSRQTGDGCNSFAAESDDEDELALISPIKKRRIASGPPRTSLGHDCGLGHPLRRMLDAACDDSDDELGF